MMGILRKHSGNTREDMSGLKPKNPFYDLLLHGLNFGDFSVVMLGSLTKELKNNRLIAVSNQGLLIHFRCIDLQKTSRVSC